jgi:hypothetical protein
MDELGDGMGCNLELVGEEEERKKEVDECGVVRRGVLGEKYHFERKKCMGLM